ncbi:unnamed protein product [Zymoseptoria tritici ST99CH_3D1]|nr:unnamed protein product [Zymoseptoria tritici ST99CH_3D1]
MPIISSADGAYIVELRDPIQEPLTKHLGTRVGVYYGVLLKTPVPVDFKAEAKKKVGHLARFLPPDEKQVKEQAGMPEWVRRRALRWCEAHDSEPENSESPGDEKATMPLDIVVKVFSVLGFGRSHADHEVAALKALTAKKCQYTPTYFGDFVLGPDHYVLMSLLPGASLDKNDSWRHDEKNVRAAFDRAIKGVHDCGIASKSTNRRNVLWDEIQGKCYIVDFERTEWSHPHDENMARLARQRWIKRGWESFDHWTAQ